jgi:uncharacterized protein (TIGR04255 family)
MINIPKVERKAFKRHFIRQAILEVRFSPVKIDWNVFTTEELRKKLNAVGITGIVAGIKNQVQLKQEETQIKVVSHAGVQESIQLSSSDGSTQIQILEDRFILTSPKYEDFDSFIDKGCTYVTLICEVIGVAEFIHLGLRKVNDLIVQNDGENGYDGGGVNNLFFSPIKQGIIPKNAVVAAENKYILAEGPYRLLMLIKSQKQTLDQFILTLDINWQKDVKIGIENSDMFKKECHILNDSLFETFFWIISDDLRDNMNA